MADPARRRTRNPIRLAYANARYDVGIALEKLLRSRRDRFPRLYKWAHRSEAALNCIIDPWLGKASRLESVQRRHGLRAHELTHLFVETPAGPAMKKLYARHQREVDKTYKAALALAYHRLLVHPDDPDALYTVLVEERVREARA